MFIIGKIGEKTVGKKWERGKGGLFCGFCIQGFPPDSLKGEKILGEFLKTQI